MKVIAVVEGRLVVCWAMMVGGLLVDLVYSLLVVVLCLSCLLAAW